MLLKRTIILGFICVNTYWKRIVHCDYQPIIFSLFSEVRIKSKVLRSKKSLHKYFRTTCKVGKDVLLPNVLIRTITISKNKRFKWVQLWTQAYAKYIYKPYCLMWTPLLSCSGIKLMINNHKSQIGVNRLSAAHRADCVFSWLCLNECLAFKANELQRCAPGPRLMTKLRGHRQEIGWEPQSANMDWAQWIEYGLLITLIIDFSLMPGMSLFFPSRGTSIINQVPRALTAVA